MVTGARAMVTEEEFLALPESTRPAEYIDGDVIAAPSPTVWHQQVLVRLVSSLQRWSETRDATVLQASMDVRFGPGRILQPDAMVFMPRLAKDTPAPIERIPTLCVEVLSANRVYDRVTKRLLYAQAGVEEYWLVDPAGLIERRTGPELLHATEVGGELASEALPGFALDCNELFG